MQIIPAIDLMDGKCVRLTEGNYDRTTVYNSSPLDMAKRFQDHGITRLHLVDLDGARSGSVQHWKVAEEIVVNTDLQIDFGGGVKTTEAVKRILDLGIEFVTVGSIAAKEPEKFGEWIGDFGPEKFLLGADTKDGMVMVSGWLESTHKPLIPYMQHYYNAGIQNMFCTDISKDGQLNGPATELYKEIKNKIPGIFLVASGGVSCLRDLIDLANAGCDGAIVGKAIYENKISLSEIENFITGKMNYAG